MLDVLVADILADFTDETGDPLAPEAFIRRQAERALPVVAGDLAVAYELTNDEISPDMPGDHRELWVMQIKILLCRTLRAQAATRVSFSSGDKKMDRSKEASHWAALEKDLANEYVTRIQRINPAADENLIHLNIRPRIYTQNRRNF